MTDDIHEGLAKIAKMIEKARLSDDLADLTLRVIEISDEIKETRMKAKQLSSEENMKKIVERRE